MPCKSHRCPYCGNILAYTGDHEEGCPMDLTDENEYQECMQLELNLEYANS